MSDEFSKNRTDYYSLLKDVSNALFQATGITELLKKSLDVIGGGLCIRRSLILLRTGNYFTVKILRIIDGDNKKTLMALKKGRSFPCSHVRQESLIKKRIIQSPRHIFGCQLGEFMSVFGIDASIPLFSGKKMVGILSLGKKPLGAPFSGKERAFLTIAADLISIAVHNAWLNKEIERNKATQKTGIEKSKPLPSESQTTAHFNAFRILAAGVAHEIKNPLSAVKTFVQLLPGKIEDEEFRRDFFRVVPAEVDRINRLVEKLLNVPSQQDKPFEPVNVNKVILEVLLLLKYDLSRHAIVTKKVFPKNGASIAGNAEKLKQVFLNLFINSLHAMEKNGILSIKITAPGPALNTGDGSLFIMEKPFSIIPDAPYGGLPTGKEAVRRQNEIVIEITDTGHGIPPQNIPCIFTPLFTTKGNGHGLGLAVVKSIVTEHHGQIRVESKEGAGTTFFIHFPAYKKG